MDERIAIGVATHGTFAPATRLEAKAYIESAVKADLASSTALVKTSREDLARRISIKLAAGSKETEAQAS